jgi:DNA replicative helicase MCM subunit Mcm2 (Cdc46/Mcm family)
MPLSKDGKDLIRKVNKKADERKRQKQSKSELISVATAIRRSSGRVTVPGMIIGVSTVVQMTMQTEIRCVKCDAKIANIKHNPPLFSVPAYLTKSKKCVACDEYTGFSEHKEISAMIIQLQDDKKQNDLESLSVVLFDNDTLDVRNGEQIIVTGSLHVVQQKNNGKRVTYLFADVNCGIQREELQNHEDVKLTQQDIAELTEYSKKPDYINEIISMFAPNVIGHEDEKLGVVLMYIGAPENQDFRGRLHVLFVGPPGLAKTKLAKEARELGRPYSRYSSAKGAASGKSITVIIEKENDTYILRLGVLLQAHGSVCVINEISALPLDEQGHLYDIMEEGMKTIDSYTFHKEIEAATSVLATTNPLRGKWQNDTASTGQIPLTLPHLDRYDLIFVFKSLKDEGAKLQYAKSKFEIFRKYSDPHQQQQQEHDYSRLRKIIKHAKSFQPQLSEEAENVIMQCWAGVSSSAFPTNRIFETIVRTSMTYARLRFSNVVTSDIAKQAIDFLAKMYKEFDSSVSVVHDPRDAACFEIANYLQENPNMPYDFSDLINRATEVNRFVEAYLGPSPVNNNNSKYRDIADRFKQGLVGDGFIFIERDNPLRLCFKPDNTKAEAKYKQQQQEEQQQQRELSPEELQKIPIPDSIERLGHSDLFACKNKNCSKRGDIWEMKKHALYYCTKKPAK